MSRRSHSMLFGTVTGILFVGALGGTVFLATAIEAQQKPASTTVPAPVPGVHPGATPVPVKPGLEKPAGEPMLLRMHFKQGVISRYRMSMRATLPQLAGAQGASARYDTNIDLVLQQKVEKVRPDGSADIAVSTTSGTGVVNGSPFKPLDSPSLITLDERNTIVSARRLPSNQSADALTGTMFQTGELSTQGVYLPKLPVKVGDVWTQKVGINNSQKGSQKDGQKSGSPDLTGTVKSTFVRMETIGLFNTVRLHSEVRVPFVVNDKASGSAVPMKGMLSMNYDSNVSLSTGQVVRSAGDGNITLDVRLSGGGPAPSSGSKGSSTGKTRAQPAGKSAGTKSSGMSTAANGASEAIQRVVVKLQLGNNLITP